MKNLYGENLFSKDELILKISDENIDIDEFVEIALNNQVIRDNIIQLMLKNKQIMVYYHSYYVIARASEVEPNLFYPYWDDFASLLNHPNSYHRDFALVILANLTKVDIEDKFSHIYTDYFKHINDAKFMTARQCVQNTAKILANKKELTDNIIDILLDMDGRCDFAEKQKALLKSDIIEVFDEFYEQINNKKGLNRFVKNELDSISPKTRKKAKEFIRTYNL